MTQNKKQPRQRPHDIFINELLKGKSQRQSYLVAYPERFTWSPGSLDVSASELFNSPKVKARYEAKLAKIQEKEQKEVQWTREQSIQNLRYVIERNREDVDRIEQAIEMEISLLAKQIQDNPEEAPYLVQSLLAKQRARRMTNTNNTGIIAAVAELNKMQGFNEENINMSSTVVFSGASDLED